MSRGKKLTEEQRQHMATMRSCLKKVLPASERNFAAGIASGLVRCAAPLVSDEDLERVLAEKCAGSVSEGLRATVIETLLVPSEGEEGGYALRSRDELRGSKASAAKNEAGTKTSAAEVETEDFEATDGTTDSDAAAESEEAAPEAAVDDERGEGGEVGASGEQPSAAAESSDDQLPVARCGHGRSRDRHGKTGFQRIRYVRRGDDADAEARARIVELDQRLWMNGWLLSHPSAYTIYERELSAISELLAGGALPEGITRRQLAYRLGGNEKFFEYGSDGFKLLRAMGLEDIARHRHLPKTDVLYFAPRRRKRMRVLVTENLDPFLDVRDSMYEDGQTRFLGERIHAVVLGAGSPILERKRLVSVLDSLGADEVEVLYWGDIDRAGVDIYLRLRDLIGGRCKISPFVPAYQLMLDHAMEIYPDPTDNEGTGQIGIEPGDYEELLDGLTEEAGAYFRAVVDGCGLVPQEILTRRDLVEELDTGE